MKKKKMRIISIALIVLLIILAVTKCSTNKDTTKSTVPNTSETTSNENKGTTKPIKESKKPSDSGNKNSSSSENKSNSNSNNTSNTNKPSSGSGSSNSGSNSSSNSGSNNGGTTNKPSSGSNNSNSGNSSSTEKPAHKHNWVNVTKTVNHPAETHQEDVYENRQVKVKDAWDEKVYVGTTIICRQCEYTTSDQESMDMHMLETGHSSTSKDNYKTVHHDAVYETQRVKTGTKTVTDKAAWTETVVTGKKCSSCGETK